MNNSKGYVALTSVLLIGALILIVGVSAIITSTKEVDAVKMYKDSRQALFSANSCAEIGIVKIKEDNTYQGRQRFNVGEFSCNILSVTDIVGGKTFDAVAKVNDTERRLKINVMDDLSFSITHY